MIGSTDSSTPLMTTGMFWVCRPASVVKPAISGRWSSDWRNTSAINRSFQTKKAVTTPSVAIAGLANGTTTVGRMVSGVAPSVRAASRIPRGMPLKN
jgi:hypothetical protein